MAIEYPTCTLLWDLPRGEATGRLPSRGAPEPSLDGRRLFAPDGTDWHLWDISQPTRPRRLTSFTYPDPKPTRVLTADGAFFLLGPSEPETAGVVATHDGDSGRLLWQLPLPRQTGGRLSEAFTRRHVVLAGSKPGGEPGNRYLIDPHARRVVYEGTDLWTISGDGRWAFRPAGRLTEVTDITRGQVVDLLVWPEGYQAVAITRPRCRWLWVRGDPDRRDGTTEHLVIDWPSRRRLLQFRTGTPADVYIADDGSFALVERDEGEGYSSLTRYDRVSATPWLRAVSVPVLLGAAILAWRWSRSARPKAGDVAPAG